MDFEQIGLFLPNVRLIILTHHVGLRIEFGCADELKVFTILDSCCVLKLKSI